MKSLKILELELTNFKGARNIFFDLGGHSAKFRGANGTYKSTLRDSIIWLFTGKDAFGRGELDFEIKTYDANNVIIPMIDHGVRGTFDLDGDVIEFRRVFKEVWRTKKSSISPDFSGHTTCYYINGIEKSQKEYTDFIERNIAPIKIICLLIVLGYFNEQIKPEERRKFLLDSFGGVSEEEMLALSEWSELAKYITRFTTVADLKKSKKTLKTSADKEKENIKPEVKAHDEHISDNRGLNKAAEQSASDQCAAEINKRTSDLLALDNGEALSRLRRELSELESEQIKASVTASKKKMDATDALRKELQKAKDKRQNIQDERAKINSELSAAQIKLKNAQFSKEVLLKKYDELWDSAFDGEDTCPTCGQPLPPETIESAKTQFNENKAKGLEKIIVVGKAATLEIKSSEDLILRRTEDLTALDKALIIADRIVSNITISITETPDIPSGFDDSLIEAKRSEIEALSHFSDDMKSEIAESIRALKEKKIAHDRNLFCIEEDEKTEKRIKELLKREKEIAAQIEECERIIDLCDQFTNARAKTLDEHISEFFNAARFKLTDTQVNGDIKEICDTIIGGVPYVAANNAKKVLVNCDIIATFQRHYGVSMPVFVDGKESVAALPPMDCQLITLHVPTPFYDLPAELQEHLIDDYGSEEEAQRAYEEPYKTLKMEIVWSITPWLKLGACESPG